MDDRQLGIVGLGRIGSALALNALGKGVEVVGYNKTKDKTEKLVDSGVRPAWSLPELAQALARPRGILVYAPHGAPLDPRDRALRNGPLSLSRSRQCRGQGGGVAARRLRGASALPEGTGKHGEAIATAAP